MTYNFIDLFAGAGGLSEGFIQAGFVPIAHVEIEKSACNTLKTRAAYHYLKSINKYEIYVSYLKGEINREELYKNLPDDKLDKLLLARLVLDGIAAFKFVFSLEFLNFWAVIKAHYQFNVSIKKFRKKRLNNLKEMKIKEHLTMYNKSIVIDFFVHKKKYFNELPFKP